MPRKHVPTQDQLFDLFQKLPLRQREQLVTRCFLALPPEKNSLGMGRYLFDEEAMGFWVGKRIRLAEKNRVAHKNLHGRRGEDNPEMNNLILNELSRGLKPGQIVKLHKEQYPNMNRDVVNGVKRRAKLRRKK
jgi:hypothetical protein